jgi:cytochrome c556
MRKFTLSVCVLSLSLSGLAMAEGISLKPDEIIAARQGGMALAGGVVESMKAGVASGAEVKPFTDGAGGLAKWGHAYPALFPDGTQTGHETKAKPEIWSDRPGFEKASATMAAAAEKLGEVAKTGDKAAFKTAFEDLGKACGGCHRNYKNR